jgi:trimeric autotransporter adhesin
VNVTTTAAVATMVKPKVGGWANFEGGAVLALLVLFGIPARRRSWRAMLGVLALMVALGGLAACGGGGGSSSGGGGGGTPGTT